MINKYVFVFITNHNIKNNFSKLRYGMVVLPKCKTPKKI